jgi:type II secretory pathway pseudopilin PulG
LIEVMVAIGIFSLVMLIVSGALMQTSKITKAQTQRSLRQANLQSTMRHLETALRHSALAGVSWHRAASVGAVLAAQPIQDGVITTGAPATQPFWRCFVWDENARTLSMGESTDAGGFAPPSTSRYQAMSVAQMGAILASETPLSGTLLQGRRVADRVTNFAYGLESGPLMRIEIELDVPLDDRAPDAQERLRGSIKIHPRNRI